MAFNWNNINSLHNALGKDVVTVEQKLTCGDKSNNLLRLRPEAGDGTIELVKFNPECSVSIFNCSWKQPRIIHVNDQDRIRFNFSLALDMIMEFDEKDEHDLNMPSWRFINHSRKHIVHESIAPGSKTSWVTVGCTADYLSKITGDTFFEKNSQFNQLFKKHDEQSVYREFPLDHTLNQISSNIISSHINEDLHLRYLEAKIQELLYVALDAMLQESKHKHDAVVLRDRDRQAINLAREIIESNLEKAPSINELCLMIGMNRNKLHYGFKTLYGMPVSHFIKEARLDYAYQRLKESDDNILKVALDVGFNHQSSFSTAFKRKFGVSPKDLKK